jgi:hypothetical protein
MPIRDSMVHDVFVVIDINDESTYDQEFVNQIKYGESFVFDAPNFSDEEREQLQDPATQGRFGSLDQGKFVITVYPDRMWDFIDTMIANPKWKRSLTFLSIMANTDPDDPDYDDTEPAIAHVYELSTIKRVEDSIEDGFLLDDGDDVDFDEEVQVPKSATVH